MVFKNANSLSLWTALALCVSITYSCNAPVKKNKMPEASSSFFKLSLAQWSMNKMIKSGEVSPYTFAEKAKAWGFEGLEYVNNLYVDVMQSEAKSEALAAFVEKSNALAKEHGMKNVLIMIDSEGDLASSDEALRNQAIENHKQWIDAAAKMGCSAVRLNLHGENDPQLWVANSIQSLTALSDYAAPQNINVIVENHGRLSSNAGLLMQVINGVNLDNCGTLPDFGNFCMSEGYGSLHGNNCDDVYDPYLGVKEMMPKAFGVSAKSFEFDADGNETTLDYKRLIKIVKDSGYNGFIGVEYEGSKLSEEDGIAATRDLLLKIAKEL
jgi:sugar phosphate isomerase/epimerase